MSTRAEYSLLVPRPASLAGWVPVSLLWAMLGWVSRKQAWSEQLIHDYTIRESVPLAANRDISTFATEKPRFTLRQQPLGWVREQNACLLHHLSQGHHCPCHVTACVPSWWGFPSPQPSSTVTSWVFPGVPLDMLTLWHPGVYLGREHCALLPSGSCPGNTKPCIS